MSKPNPKPAPEAAAVTTVTSQDVTTSADEIAALKAELAALKAAKTESHKAAKAQVVEPEPAPGLISRIKEYGKAMTTHPIFGAMFTEARDASALATRNRIGKAMNFAIRTKILAPMLPMHMQAMLRIPFVAALVDFVISNAVMALVILFGDKLPKHMGEITLTIARCTTTNAYVEGLELINVEELFNKVFDKDLLALAQEAADKGA